VDDGYSSREEPLQCANIGGRFPRSSCLRATGHIISSYPPNGGGGWRLEKFGFAETAAEGEEGQLLRQPKSRPFLLPGDDDDHTRINHRADRRRGSMGGLRVYCKLFFSFFTAAITHTHTHTQVYSASIVL